MSQFIKNLEIKNFKSIKHLQLDCRRVNVLIGKPNVGKSNILEAMSILGAIYSESYFLSELIRYNTINDIFFDKNYYKSIEVNTDVLSATIEFNKQLRNPFTFSLSKVKDRLDIINALTLEKSFSQGKIITSNPKEGFYQEFTAKGEKGERKESKLGMEFKKYSYDHKSHRDDDKISEWSQFLSPPYGKNIFEILRTLKPLRKLISNTLKEYQLDFVYIDEKSEFVIQKNIDGEVTQFSYSSMADTFQRLFFYLAAIESNKNSTLILEEPEVHSFPPYVKLLAEKIAEDIDNQYFITTHSPYLLSTLLENLKDDEINIAITYFDDYETKIKVLSPDELSEVQDFGTDLFFNLDLFVKSDGKIHS